MKTKEMVHTSYVIFSEKVALYTNNQFCYLIRYL